MFETNKKTFPFCVSCKNTASNAKWWSELLRLRYVGYVEVNYVPA